MYIMQNDFGVFRPLEFDWDKGNVDKNWQKHQASYQECEEIFINQELKIYFDAKHTQSESRFTAFGVTNKNRKLIINFTYRNNKIRVISARDMSRRERKLYEEK